ncbi:MAG: BREX-1 system adenine-specific DNA-methyltransferase PglX, partial [Sedimentibacter sp.]
RSYNRRALSAGIINNVGAIQESNGISQFYCEGITKNEEQNKVGEYLVSTFKNAKEIGSLLTVEGYDHKTFYEYLLNLKIEGQIDIFSSNWISNTLPLIEQLTKQAVIMSNKYNVVCTNPPYMNKLESYLKDFVTNNYKPYSGDLFSVFMYRNFAFCKQGGYSAFMTPNVWMFIKSYEKLREFIITQKCISSLIQMAKGAFFKEATVDICAFVLENRKKYAKGIYIRLEDFKGDMDIQKQKVLEALANSNCSYLHEINSENFSKISGMPIAYWIGKQLLNAFELELTLGNVAPPRDGLHSGNNDFYLKLWYEVEKQKICFDCNSVSETKTNGMKWYPINKGGSFRKWYGNNEYIVNWENDGYSIKNFKDDRGKLRSRPQNTQWFFKAGITYSDVTSGGFSCRDFEDGFIFDTSGPGIYMLNPHVSKRYMLGLLNSRVATEVFKLVSPTIHFTQSAIAKLPVIVLNEKNVEHFVRDNVVISKQDWDSFETSWDFTRHPLLRGTAIIAEAFTQWQEFTEAQFNQLKANEEELNQIFVDIYGLKDELTPEVKDRDVTIRKANLERDICSFISYAVGCMFGRYSIDEEGLAYAGGEWNEEKYSTFIPDQDNIIPITDEEYFKDDIVGLFCAFLKKTFGEETLEENLDFIAKALANNGNSSREIIRNYFLKDFFKDHCKIYKKRPIYWLFDSGKADGFKALVYMHRYNEDTIGNLRIDYLHKMQRVYESEISRMQEIIENSNNTREVSAATKRKEKLVKQLKETKEYDEKIAHLALTRIAIDLDDGVKVNYEKVQTGTDGEKFEVLAKIK